MKEELFDRDLECYTKMGSELFANFDDLVNDLVVDACNVFNTVDVEAILTEVISQKCLFNRVHKSLNKRIKQVDKVE